MPPTLFGATGSLLPSPRIFSSELNQHEIEQSKEFDLLTKRTPAPALEQPPESLRRETLSPCSRTAVPSPEANQQGVVGKPPPREAENSQEQLKAGQLDAATAVGVSRSDNEVARWLGIDVSKLQSGESGHEDLRDVPGQSQKRQLEAMAERLTKLAGLSATKCDPSSDDSATLEQPDDLTAWAQCSLDHLRQIQANFSSERDWDQFHTPRNLILAMTKEVGELAEVFQWEGEVSPGLPGAGKRALSSGCGHRSPLRAEFGAEKKQAVADELADVLLYLVRIADRSGVDLAKATLEKIEKNKLKYPADKCRGSSAKYTAYNA